MTSLLRFRNQLLEVKKARKNQKIKILKTKDQKIVRVKILAKGWDAERIVKNLKSTTECFDVISKEISEDEIEFICESESIAEFVRELCE
jgi:hypothetical protein